MDSWSTIDLQQLEWIYNQILDHNSIAELLHGVRVKSHRGVVIADRLIHNQPIRRLLPLQNRGAEISHRHFPASQTQYHKINKKNIPLIDQSAHVPHYIAEKEHLRGIPKRVILKFGLWIPYIRFYLGHRIYSYTRKAYF